MFGSLKQMVGNVTLRENNGKITIEGVNSETFRRDVTKIWSTSKVTTTIFDRLTRGVMSFPAFFALDVDYLFSVLLTHDKAWSIKRTIKKAQELLRESSWLSSVYQEHPDRLDLSKLNRFKLKPLPHQQEFLTVYNNMVSRYQLNGYLLNGAPGSGKTLLSLMIAECLNAKTIVIISPNNAIYRVWESTILNQYTKDPGSVWISKSGEPLTGKDRFYIFHYESLSQLKALANMRDMKDTVIIVDECHNFNEINSQRTGYLVEFTQQINCKNSIWASGTPIKAIGYECIPLLRCIDRFFDSTAEDRFRKIFGKSASKAIDILRHRLGMISYKISKSDYTDQVVDEEIVNVRTPNGNKYTLSSIRDEMQKFIKSRILYYKENKARFEDFYSSCLAIHKQSLRSSSQKKSFEQYKAYVNLIKNTDQLGLIKDEIMYCNQYELKSILPSLPNEHRKDFKSVRSVIKYVKLKIQGEALGRILGKSRAQCHIDMIPYMRLEEFIDSAQKKTIIFSSYVEVVDKINDYCKQLGYKPLVVYGETNKEVTSIVNQFDKDEDSNPLIATYQSLSTAVPLTMANMVIMTNQPFRAHEEEQSIARAARLGQDTQVYVKKILLDTGNEANVSTRSNDIMEWSREQVAALTSSTGIVDLQMTLESYGVDDDLVHIPSCGKAVNRTLEW